MTTLHELLAKKAELEKQAGELETQLRAARQEERQGVIQQIKSLMAEHGLTVADLAVRGMGDRRSAAAGRPVAAKYRNTATGESWSGRGLKPKWVIAALASGKTLDDLAIR